jgi:hypothetical protein
MMSNGNSSDFVVQNGDIKSYNDHVCEHLHQCYVQGILSDTEIRLHGTTTNQQVAEGTVLKAHRIILLRSPLLSRLIMDRPLYTMAPIELDILAQDPLITTHGFAIALGHLYGSFAITYLQQQQSDQLDKQHLNQLFKSVLASATLLGLSDLIAFAYDHLRRDINIDTIVSYVELVCTCNQEPAQGMLQCCYH